MILYLDSKILYSHFRRQESLTKVIVAVYQMRMEHVRREYIATYFYVHSR